MQLIEINKIQPSSLVSRGYSGEKWIKPKLKLAKITSEPKAETLVKLDWGRIRIRKLARSTLRMLGINFRTPSQAIFTRSDRAWDRAWLGAFGVLGVNFRIRPKGALLRLCCVFSTQHRRKPIFCVYAVIYGPWRLTYIDIYVYEKSCMSMV
jgi:hypothetical protein